jgi:hypothetical protein
MKVLALGVFLLTVPLAASSKSHDWQTGRVIRQEMNSYDAGAAAVPIGGSVVAVPIRRTSNQVILEANGYRFTLLEKPSKHYVVLAENSNVQFYQDGQWFVFLDINKKEHKFSLLHMEKLP